MNREETIQKLHDKFSVFPVNKDKSPKTYWAVYREKKINIEELLSEECFAIVCGFENLEVIDIDNHFGDANVMYEFIQDNLTKELSDLIPVISTGGGGYHLYYKCEKIEGNKKLASRINSQGRPETLIETRGIGGYVVAPPTNGYDVILNDIYNVPIITEEQREELLSICKSLNEVESKKQEKKKEATNNDEQPGTRYNNDPDAIQHTVSLLIKHGWTSNDNKHWKRPGKETRGISATFGKVGINKFYVFSSNAYPFDIDTSYSMWGVLSMLEYGGNYSESAKAIAADYGMNQQKKKPEKKEPEKKEKPTKNDKWRVFEEIIEDWKLKFRYNELSKIVEYNHKDEDWRQLGLLPNDIVREMEAHRGIKEIAIGKVIEMIKSTDICQVFNPIDDFINNIPQWDGTDWINKLFDSIELQEDEDRIYSESMFKKHLIRAIRCASEKEYINRFVFTFYGPQEIGKTKLIQWICPPHLYDDETIDPGKRDSMLKLGRYLIINMDELDSLQRKEVSKLKAFISKGEIKTRVAYGKVDEIFYRVSSLFASTNKSDILADETNTRWLIIKVKSYNWRTYTKDIDPMQIWAQCLQSYMDDPESGELTKEEKMERERRNSQSFLETSSEREILLKWFEDGEEYLTATDIKISIENKLYPIKINLSQLVRELRRVFGEPRLTANEEKKVGRYYRLKNNLEYKQVSELFNNAPAIKDLPF